MLFDLLRAETLRRVIPALILTCAASPLAAQELRLGVSAEITSADPHFQSASANNALWRHVYEPLVGLSDTGESMPALAASWRLLSPTEWEFTRGTVHASPTASR